MSAQALAVVEAKVRDPLNWLQHHTKTKDSHWREVGATTPYRPFPDKPYFRPIVDAYQTEDLFFVEKSRDLMLSWICMGLLTHTAMTVGGLEILAQSLKEDKAIELVEYGKTLYENSDEDIRRAYPLAKPLRDQQSRVLEFANGSRIIGIPGGADQIRSYHPFAILLDEAAFQPEAGECYDHAVPVCSKIIVVSSAGPGWFSEFVSDNQ